MRRRLLILMLGLTTSVLLALGVPLGIQLAGAAAREVYLDRLSDATRFASIARQTSTSTNSDVLSNTFQQYREVYGISAALLDREGKVLVASDDTIAIETDFTWFDVAVGGRRHDPPGHLWPWDSSPLVIAEPVIDGGDVIGVIVTSSSTVDARWALLSEWGTLGLTIGAATFGCIVFALVISRWILRPIRIVDQVAHDIATGEMSARVPVETGPPELVRLGSTFNDMADSLSALVERQRAFVADASHQLRNQLHALMIRLNTLTLSSDPDSVKDAELATAEAERLAAILDQLLELAKAEQDTDTLSHPFDLRDVVQSRMLAWQPAAAARGITMDLDCPDPAAISGDPVAVEGALDVVLDNAIKFSAVGGPIHLVVEVGPTRSTVSVTDSGDGLEPLELTRVGSRFWRSRRHQNIPGSGLGISIARTLLAAAGGRLVVANAPPAGLRVTMILDRTEPAELQAPSPLLS